MLTIFEGARNSGKTYLSTKYSQDSGVPMYKFEYTKWFEFLDLKDNALEAHALATGKEMALLQLNRDGILRAAISDRGPFTILVWGVMSGRITQETATLQLRTIIELGLLDKCKIVYINGDNPDQSARNKDLWDFRDDDPSIERSHYEFFIDQALEIKPDLAIYKIQNTFDERTTINI